MSNESNNLLEKVQDDEACKNCKMRKAINYIATEAASDICNTDGKVINMNIVCVGALDGALVMPREIFKSSILSNAAWILLFHNHPSGRLVPSKDDKFLTQRVREAGMILGIELKDHVIIGNREGQYYSFHEAGILGRDFRKEYLRESYDINNIR